MNRPLGMGSLYKGLPLDYNMNMCSGWNTNESYSVTKKPEQMNVLIQQKTITLVHAAYFASCLSTLPRV